MRVLYRYFIGGYILYWIGWFGGDIIIASISLGIAFGFIDLMKEKSS